MSSDHPASPAAPSSTFAHRIHQSEALFAALVVLSGVGIGVTSFSPQYGFYFWMAMVPLFGGASAILAVGRERPGGETSAAILRMQVLHWLGAFAALWLIFLLQRAGQLGYDALGLVALATLALSTFLAGVHGDWRLCGVGVLLGGIVVVGSYVQQLAWVLLVPGAALAAFAGTAWLRRRGAQPSVSSAP